MSKIDWSKEHRQAPIGLVLFFGETVRKLIKGLWPMLLILLFDNKEEGRADIYLWAGLGISAFVLINAVLSYWYFRFQIVGDELVVKKGYLKKVRLTVPLDRIQTINIKQNVFQQVLRLVTLEVDTAGSGKAEIKFIAIHENISDQLKEEFQSKISKNIHLENELEGVDASDTDHEVTMQLSTTDLFKVGLSENHVRSFLVIISLFYWLYYQLESIFKERIDEYAEEGVLMASEWSMKTYIIIAIVLFGITIFISFIRAVLGFYNLSLKKFQSSFKLQFGLLSLKEVNIPFSKVQFISWHNNPLRSLFNFKSLKIKQASSNDNDKRKQSIEIPACRREHEDDIEQTIFRLNEQSFSSWHHSHWIYFVRAFVLLSMLCTIVSMFLWKKNIPYFIFFVTGIESIVFILSILAYQKRKFRIGEYLIEIQKGHIHTDVYKMLNFKIQSVSYKQNIMMKYRKIASLTLYTAAGKHITIPFINEEFATNVYNYLLYKIESTNEKWM